MWQLLILLPPKYNNKKLVCQTITCITNIFKKTSIWGYVFGTTIKTLLVKALHSILEFTPDTTNVYSGGQHVMVQVAGSLPPTWETWINFPALRHVGSESEMGILSLPLKSINNYKIKHWAPATVVNYILTYLLITIIQIGASVWQSRSPRFREVFTQRTYIV